VEQPESSAEPGAANEGASEGSAAEKPSATKGVAAEGDAQAALQAVIDDDALTPYLKLEEPGRFPLRISGDVLPPGLQLTKASKPVLIVDATEASDKKKAVLVFTEFEIKGDRASAAYRYDIEKVRGSATVKKEYGNWTVVKSRVTERDVQSAPPPK
jgi:hypothetical protein